MFGRGLCGGFVLFWGFDRKLGGLPLAVPSFAMHGAGDGRPPLANNCLPHFRHADHAGRG